MPGQWGEESNFLSSNEFTTLAGPAEAETRVKGSRFLALAFPAVDEPEARAVLDARSRARFDATHHCVAWRFRDGGWRAIDAGEPSGSAGAPILAAIDGAGLVDVAIVVTRYFGGTKLGVGGLARAYGEAAAQAVGVAPLRRGAFAERLAARYSFADTSPVMRALERSGASAVDYDFPADQDCLVSFTVPSGEVGAVGMFLTEQTSGRVTIESLGSTVVYLS